jgi:hypothetical protein
VSVDVFPPARPVELLLTVETTLLDDVIGVTAVHGITGFEVVTLDGSLVLRFVDALPPDAATVTVRFRKGEDVWHLSSTPDDAEVALVVPSSEPDRFRDADPQWVLFTVHDSKGGVLDVGGELIP